MEQWTVILSKSVEGAHYHHDKHKIYVSEYDRDPGGKGGTTLHPRMGYSSRYIVIVTLEGNFNVALLNR